MSGEQPDFVPPEFLSHEELQAFRGGRDIKARAVLCLLGEHIYKREDDRWRLLDHRAGEPSETA